MKKEKKSKFEKTFSDQSTYPGQKRYRPENWFSDGFDDSRRFRLLELVNEWVDVLNGRL
jgi:hypothetical protein